MPQSIDELLRAAKASLTHANALDASLGEDYARIGADANRQIQDIEQNGPYRDPNMDPTGFLETVQNAKRFGSTFARDAGNAALGLGKLVTTSPYQTAQDTGNQIVGDFIQHGAGQGTAAATEALTGLPIRQVGSDFAQGNYPEAAAHVAVGGLAALLLHKAGAGAGEPEMAPTGRAVRWAPSEAPESLGPNLPPPSTEPYVGGKAAPLKSLLGLDPQSFEAPGRAAGNLTGNVPEATPRFPTMSDEAAAGHVPSAEGYEQFLPNQPAAPTLEPASPQLLEPQAVTLDVPPGKPRISASEFASILRGREKFRSANPDATLPPGAQTEMDRMGLEYSRTQSELKRLLGLDTPSPAEAADLPRYQQAARELGARLRGFAKSAPDNPAAPPSAPPASAPPASIGDMLRASLDAQGAESGPRQAHFKLPEKVVPDEVFAKAAETIRQKNPNYRADEHLVERRQFPRPGGGAVTPLKPDLGPEYAPADASNGLLGNLLKSEEGSYNPEAIKQAFSPENRQKLGALAQAHQAGALLFSPLTVARIGVSNTFAALLKAAEHAANEHSFAPLGRTVRELGNVRQMARDAVDAFQRPDEIHTRLDVGAERPKGIFGIASRAVGAVDRPFRNAMERAGFSPEDALSVTQQRTPITKWGKSMLAAQQGSTFMRLAIPFAKSGINLVEQGVVEPLMSAGKVLTGEATPGDVVKIAGATGAGAAGYYGSKKLEDSGAPNWVKRLAIATAGQYEIPAELGQAAADASGLNDFLKRGVRNVPVVGPGLDPSPTNLVHRVLPKIVNPDYWTGTERDTTDPRTGKQSDLRKIEAEIPGLAQLLRVKRTARPTRPARRPR